MRIQLELTRRTAHTMLPYNLFKGGCRRPIFIKKSLPCNLLQRNGRRGMHGASMPILRKQIDSGLENIEEEELYRYTRHRWLYNESEQLANRYRKFNISNLVEVSVNAAGNGAKSCVEIIKCVEGQRNKAMIMKMDNGTEVVAKLPHPNAGPAFYTTSSEVATRSFLREVVKFPIPKVLSYSADGDNSVGAEYIIEEKAVGEPLEKFWPRWDMESKRNLVTQLVDLETDLTAVTFKEHGCIYFKKDLKDKGVDASTLQGSFTPLEAKAFVGIESDRWAMGPLTEPRLWQGEREKMALQRGPWSDPLSYMRSIAENELEWMVLHGKAQIKPYDRLGDPEYEDYDFVLRAFLRAWPKLDTRPFPTSLSHPDLGLSNVYVDPYTKKITCITGWQSASASEPFFQSELPSMLVQYGSWFSRHEKLAAAARNNDFTPYLADHYRNIKSVKNEEHWAAVNIQNRSLLYDPVSLIPGALSRNDVFPLQRVMVDIGAHWDMITAAPCPCCVAATKGVRKQIARSGEFHDLAVAYAEACHNEGKILKGGIVRAEDFSVVERENREAVEALVGEFQREGTRRWLERLWRHIFQREMN
ncbi:Phosphotransferase enzyme [Cadophora gregata]|uniref:Phosphotransferase enzyme n=1 Tax=Cadophora gregata TaxID=51156 RepID=UPI0026DA801A|nr:Phosphotransferase enzyme [Cadophora gregata]KAK0123796.1 Phosphotransferase enzyme [Cadophora gregata]KAK0130141.1 Phosphotransferase enzyme [Cadophora gregata f. sp. sojae]